MTNTTNNQKGRSLESGFAPSGVSLEAEKQTNQPSLKKPHTIQQEQIPPKKELNTDPLADLLDVQEDAVIDAIEQVNISKEESLPDLTNLSGKPLNASLNAESLSGIPPESAQNVNIDNSEAGLLNALTTPSIDAGHHDGEVLSLPDGDPYTRALAVLQKSTQLDIQDQTKATIGQISQKHPLPELACRELLDKNIITHIQLARALARAQSRLEILMFSELPPEAGELRERLPQAVLDALRERRIVPLRLEIKSEEDKTLHLAWEESGRDLVLEGQLLEHLKNYKIVWHFASRDVGGAYWLSNQEESVDSGMEAEILLDRFIGNAVDAHASDIHIDPSIRGEPRAVVKYRVDGIVNPREVISLEQLERLKVRIENLANMPKVNQNHPNKGAFSRSGFEWRVQIQPHSSLNGAVPRIVMRQLKPNVISMEKLGYPQYFIDQVKAASQAPNGVVFWTGPTGSGKTESIHSAIMSVNPMARGLSVHTIEDPPEKRISGYAVQMEIAEADPARSGLQLLKSSLRADPDVVVFGEVRDAEMAGLVFEAANTGHLVFTTLHTNTSIDAIIRLKEMDVDPFLMSYVRGVTAQRLLRRVCKHCRQPMKQLDDLTQRILTRYDIDPEGGDFYKASKEGCANCNFTGYAGRIAAAEFLVPEKKLVQAVIDARFEDLEDIATELGWKPMGYMAALHMKSGITDAYELTQKILELSGELIEEEEAA